VLERRSAGELLECRPQHVVDDGNAIAGVGGDVGQVVGMEAQVERVQHEPARGKAEIRLEMTLVVPRKGRDAVPALEAERTECGAESARACEAVAVGVAVQRPVGPAADDLAIAVQAFCVAKQGGQRQRRVHHQTTHGSLLGRDGNCAPGNTGCKWQPRPLVAGWP
jgi:hypothetical protein